MGRRRKLTTVAKKTGPRWAAYGQMLTPEEAERRLREQGSRMTAPRRALIQLLAGNGGHPTAEDLTTRVRAHLGKIPAATVYNVLDALESAGLVRRVAGLEPRAHFDPDTSPHEHALCTHCRQVWDVPAPALPSHLPEGFLVSDILIQGVCRPCSER